jgi:hypothetical protein
MEPLYDSIKMRNGLTICFTAIAEPLQAAIWLEKALVKR